MSRWPTIAGDLRISPASSIWVVNAYQLAIVVSLLALSSLGDLIGYRKIYLGGLIVFTLASLGCVLSRSLAELTVRARCRDSALRPCRASIRR